MWLFYIVQIISANLFCLTSSCTFCTQNYLYKSKSCLELCPSGYTLDALSSVCQESGPKLLFSLNFEDFTEFKKTSISEFSHPENLYFDDPSRKTPIPTLQSGFYFTQTSYLESSTSWIPAPDFTVYCIAKFNSTTGKVFRIMKNSTEVFSLFLDVKIYASWLLTTQSGLYSYNVSSVYDPDWIRLEFNLIQSATMLTVKYNRLSRSVVISNAEFRAQYSDLKFVLGDFNSSFKGFLSWLSLENSEKSSYSITVPFSQKYEGRALATSDDCKNSSCSWPWCVDDADCFLYTSLYCMNGTGYMPKDCTACTVGSAPFCGLRYGCKTGTFLNCTSCIANHVIINSICVRNPTPYNSSNPNEPVIDAKFDTIAMNYGGIFKSGAVEATYAPFNNPEIDDPWPVKERGLFFNKNQFLTLKVPFQFNYEFTISLWSRSEENGFILDSAYISIYPSYIFRIYLRSNRTAIYFKSKNLYPNPFDKWIFYHVTLSVVNYSTLLKRYFNNVLFDTLTIDGFIYSGSTNTFLDVGRNKGGSEWKGCLYRLTIWQKAITDVSSYSNICGSNFSSSCLWNCSGSQYYSSLYHMCFNCDSSCQNCSTFGTCNQCSSIKCSTCSSFNSSCTETLTNPCLPGYTLTADNKCCQLPCLTCFMSTSTSCLSCSSGYLLYGQTCVFSCPFGFTSNQSHCIVSKTSLIDISLDTISNLVTDSSSQLNFTAGNTENFYPTLDSKDPWPAMNRGYYFTSGTYLLGPSLKFGYNLTFEFWVRVKSYGFIFHKSSLRFNAGISTSVFIIGIFTMNSYEFPVNIWTRVLISLRTNLDNLFVAEIMMDEIFDTESSSQKFFNDTSTPLYIGYTTSTFSGFLWSFQVFNEYRSLFTSAFESCASISIPGCTWDCDINNYLNNSVCIQCKTTCSKGCRRATDCNLCEDPLCWKCSSFYSGCQECLPNAELIESICHCNSGFYWDEISLNCSSCSNRCKECSGSSSNCTSCTSEFNLVSSNCECPVGKYYKDLHCSNCHSSCKSCSSGTSLDCSSCKENAELQSNGSCSCIEGFYADIQNSCSLCQKTCKTCLNNFSCESCKGFMTLNNGVCSCIDSYYFNLSLKTGECDKCSEFCYTCDGPGEYDCSSCADPFELKSGSCFCKDGTFLDGSSKKCLNCSVICKTCVNQEDNCITCSSHADFDINKKCKCLTGYYLGQTGCSECFELCSSCLDLNNCITCVNFSEIVSPDTLCSCSVGFYKFLNECLPCHSSCKTCNGPDQMNCLSCKDHAKIYETMCLCENPYFFNGSACERCPSPCQSCADRFNCTSCELNSSPKNSSLCECNLNFYLDSLICSSCDDLCLSCDGPSSSDCLSCRVPLILSSGNTCQCPLKSFLSGLTCVDCPELCLNCSSLTNCYQCTVGAFLQSGVCQCESNRYQNTSNCQLCSQSCKTCFGPYDQNCLTCGLNSHIDNGTCLCDDRFYWNGTQCEICPDLCEKCLNSSFCLDCIFGAVKNVGNLCECQIGWFLSNKSCEVCDKNCEKCEVKKDYCMGCKENAYLQLNNTCLCNQGFAQSDPSNCSKCSNLCQSCWISSECEVCIQNSSLSNLKVCECSEGYFENNGSCPACDISCKSCFGSSKSQCNSCKNFSTLSPSNTCDCDQYYYWSGSACEPCQALCKSCNSSAFCSSCESNSSLKSSGQCACNEGFFQSSFTCLPCHNSCATCSGPFKTNCETCKSFANLSLNKECLCNEGFFSSSGDCLKCPDNCLGCYNQTTCFACFDNSSLNQNQFCECDSRFYQGLIGCLSCNPICEKCLGPREDQCLSCLTPLILNENSLCSCPIGYFWNGSNCNPCPAYCSQCQDLFNCSSCISNSILSNNSSCICQSGYFGDSVACIPCHATCLTCSGPSSFNCLSCKSNSALTQNTSCSCVLGYFLNSSNECQKCDSLCQNCTSSTSCHSCVNGSSLTTIGTCKCDSSYFLFSNQFTLVDSCQQCNSKCLTCSGSSQFECTSCKSNATLTLNNECICEKSLYFDFNTSLCEKCHNNCSTCFGPGANDCGCFANSISVNDSCLCVDGYFMQDNLCVSCEITCKTCRGLRYFHCIDCNDQLLLLSGMCYVQCPLGFKENAQSCFPGSDKVIAMFDFDVINHEFEDKINRLKVRSIYSSEIFPAYERGVYLTGNYSGLNSINNEKVVIFSPTLCVSIWFNPHSDGTLFEYHSSLNESFQIFSELEIPILSISLSFNQSLSSLGPYISKSWNHILFCMEFEGFFTFSLILNKQVSSSVEFSEAPFKDFLNSSILIGKSLFNDKYFKGFIFSVHFFKSKPDINELVNENCDFCSICMAKGNCLTVCNITEFSEKDLECKNCSEKCTSGCRNAENCSLCSDEGCVKCKDFNKKSCLECSDGFELKDNECRVCTSEEFFDSKNKTCNSCRGLCSSCLSASECLTCKENSKILSENLCRCIEGFKESENKCTRNTFTALIKVAKTNKVSLIFTETLSKELQYENMQILTDSKKVNFTKVSITLSNYLLEVISESSESNFYSLQFLTELVSVKNSVVFPLNYSFQLFEKAEDVIIQEIQDMKSYAQTITQSGLATVFGASVISADPSTLFTFLNSAEIFSYVVLFNCTFDPLLVAFLNALKPSSMVPNLFEKVVPKSSGQRLEKKYKEFGIDTNLLLINVGIYYQFLALFLFLSLITFALSFVKHRFAVKVTSILKGFLMFKAFLRLWIQSCLEVTIASLLGVFEGKIIDSYSFFDISLCVMTIVVSGFTLIVLIGSIYKLSKISDPEILEGHKLRYNTFFEEFKCRKADDTFFYLFFVLRRYSLCYLIYFVESFILQVVVSFCFTLAVRITQIPFYIIFGQPFKEPLQGCNFICLELLTCIYYAILVLPLLIPQEFESKHVGIYCIKVVTAAIFCNIGFSFFITMKKLVNFIRSKCSRKSEKVVCVNTSMNSQVFKFE